jgi:nicotinamidase-related amidase
MLLESSDSVLIVIDVQDHFLAKFSDTRRQSLLERIGWLIAVAGKLDIPVITTAEDIPKLGATCQQLLDILPRDHSDINKMVFSLAGDNNTMSAVENTGCKTAILVGLETDVCVCHSAIGLFGRGYRVAVVEDATGSPGDAHRQGIERMRQAGIIVTSTKGLFYEWVRTVSKATEIARSVDHTAGTPKSISL